jgi:hypothetical protein
MKKGKFILLIFIIGLTLISCEPTHKLYVVNHKDKAVDITVICDTNNYHNISDIDSVAYIDSVFTGINEWTINELHLKLPIDHVSNDTYRLTLKKFSTVLLEPKMFIPIKEIILKTQTGVDTLTLLGNERNLKELKKEGKVRTKSAHYIIYSGTTTIFEIKD